MACRDPAGRELALNNRRWHPQHDSLVSRCAEELGLVMVLPIYEQEQPGVLYNTAAVIDADGRYLGKYRKNHIPHAKGFFPEGWRALGLGGAQLVFNPSATSRGLSAYLWQLEQPAAAVANEYFIGAINRVGIEELGDDDFYGRSYFVDGGRVWVNQLRAVAVRVVAIADRLRAWVGHRHQLVQLVIRVAGVPGRWVAQAEAVAVSVVRVGDVGCRAVVRVAVATTVRPLYLDIVGTARIARTVQPCRVVVRPAGSKRAEPGNDAVVCANEDPT